MVALERAGYRARLAGDGADLERLLALRARMFRGNAGDDRDAFDATFRHLLVEPLAGGGVVAGLRLLTLPAGAGFAGSYAAQFYDMGVDRPGPGRMIEIGRLCADPAAGIDPIRLLLGALAAVVLAEDAGVLFGCVSLPGADAARHGAALGALAAQHLAGPEWQIAARVPGAVPLAASRAGAECVALPAHLRLYLAMGARVGPVAVPDPDLDTLHMLTVLDLAALPEGRRRSLLALAH